MMTKLLFENTLFTIVMCHIRAGAAFNFVDFSSLNDENFLEKTAEFCNVIPKGLGFTSAHLNLYCERSSIHIFLYLVQDEHW